jgi:putative FmdB family regulatory protein
MPIYAFHCLACGHRFDRLQKLSDPDPVECPECGEPRIARQLTAPSFRLAGGGWYETDFKKDGQRNLADKGEGGGGAEAPKAEPKPEAKADAKPAATPPAAPAAKPAKD